MGLSVEVVTMARAEINSLDLRMALMRTEYSELQTRRNAWLVILGEKEMLAVGTPSVSAGKTRSVDTELSVIARKVVDATGETGFKPKDISEKLKEMGHSVNEGFSSNLLFRMKTKGAVVLRSGRYYLPRFDPEPLDPVGPVNDEGTLEFPL